jgi:WD40 repeat protein
VQGHTKAVLGIAFSPDGRHLVTGSNDETMRIWDLASGQHVTTLEVSVRFALY